MKNSNKFLLILCLFLFYQSSLLLGSRRRRSKARQRNDDQAIQQKSRRTRNRQESKSKVERGLQKRGGKRRKPRGPVISRFGRGGRIKRGFYQLVEDDQVKRDEDDILKVVPDNRSYGTSAIKRSEPYFYRIYYDESVQCVKIRNLTKESYLITSQIIRDAKSYEIVSEKYLFVKIGYRQYEVLPSNSIIRQIFKRRAKNCYRLTIFDLSKGSEALGRPVQTIENVRSYEMALGRYLCARTLDGTLRIFDLFEGSGEVVKIIKYVESCQVALGRYLCVETKGHRLKIFDLSLSSKRPIKIIKHIMRFDITLNKYLCVRTDNNRNDKTGTLKIFDLSKGYEVPIQTIENVRYRITASERYLCVFTDCDKGLHPYTSKIFDGLVSLERPIKTIENIHSFPHGGKKPLAFKIVKNNLIVILYCDGGNGESQLQIFNLEQLARAVQNDEEEGEASNGVGQEYSNPIFTYVGAVGFKINDGLVSVEFSDDRMELNVFELDNENHVGLVAPDFSVEAMGSNFSLEVEGPNFGDSESLLYPSSVI